MPAYVWAGSWGGVDVLLERVVRLRFSRFAPTGLLILTLVLFTLALDAFAEPAGGETPEAILQRVYASYRPWRGKEIARDEQLFDAALAKLIRRDDACAKSAGEVGALDFDPFLDAQDFDEEGISKPMIRALGKGNSARYEVRFRLFPNIPDSPQRKLLYSFVKLKQGWRISDIAYSHGQSLRKILSRACDH